MKNPVLSRILMATVAAALSFAAACSDDVPPTVPPPPDNGGDPPPRSWVQQTALPSVYDLYGVFATSARTIAVGAGGVIIAHDGQRWVPQLSPTDSDLRGIHGTSGGVVWAVGDDGTALRFDGTAWNEINLDSGEDLTAVWALSPDVAFASSLDGFVHKYDGSNWSAFSRDYGSLHGVWASSDINVYAAGDRATVYRYNGLSWDYWHDSLRPDVTFRSVWGASANYVWAVGDDGYAVHFDGAGWRRFPTPASDTLHCMYGSGWGDPTAVGNNGTIVRDASTGWRVEDSGTSEDLYSVAAYEDAVDREHRVAVGAKTILTGSSDWTPFTRGTMHLLNDVWGNTPNNVYVVGQAGTVLHYDGSSWELMATGQMGDLIRVWGYQARLSVADTEGNIYSLDATGWQRVGGFDIMLFETTDAWQIPNGNLICSAGNTVWVMRDGAWDPLATPPGGLVTTGVWGSANDNIIAVALGGNIVRYNGSDWEAMETGTREHLTSVWGGDKSMAYAVGEFGTVLTYDGIGTVWTKININMFHDLHSVWGTSVTNVLAVGDLGTVLRFNGFEWESIGIDSVEPFFGVWQDDTENIYAVGGNDPMDGLIYRYQTTP
jgi:hypothetical protein